MKFRVAQQPRAYHRDYGKCEINNQPRPFILSYVCSSIKRDYLRAVVSSLSLIRHKNPQLSFHFTRKLTLPLSQIFSSSWPKLFSRGTRTRVLFVTIVNFEHQSGESCLSICFTLYFTAILPSFRDVSLEQRQGCIFSRESRFFLSNKFQTVYIYIYACTDKS